MAHIVTESDLSDYIDVKRQEWQTYACCSGGNSIKKLEFRIDQVTPIYRVTYQGQDTYIGALKETAVREYNALP